MSNTQGNPHAETAVSRLRNGTTGEVARAAVEATLAVVYELRTANLIAAEILHGNDMSSPQAEAEVDARLGRGKR